MEKNKITIKERFLEFISICYPSGIEDMAQYRQIENAFYIGSFALYSIICESNAGKDVKKNQKLAEDLSHELDHFFIKQKEELIRLKNNEDDEHLKKFIIN